MPSEIKVKLTKKRVASLAVAIMLLLTVGTVVAQSSLSSVVISGGPYPGAPTYTVFTEGGMYYAKNGNGAIAWSSTNASYTINRALLSLTTGRIWQETVKLVGNFTITNTIQIPAYTHLILNGRVTLADNSNCNMLELYDGKGWLVDIEGGIWDGNGDSQTTGNGFHIYYTVANSIRGETLKIHDLIITQACVDCLYMQRDSSGSAVPMVYNLQLDQPQGDDYNSFGLHLYQVNDGEFSNIRNVDRVRLSDVVMCSFSDIYINTVLNASNSYINTFNNVVFDTALHKIFMYNVDNSSFSNFICDVIGNGTVIEEAVALWSCNYNNFNNFNIGRFGFSIGNRTFTAGIWETTGSDNNMFSNIQGEDCTLNALMLNSAGTGSNYTNINGGVGSYP